MKIAVVTTTIHVPETISLLARFGANVQFFVAIDRKTPEQAVNFCQYDVPNTKVLFIQDQQKWKCSELIGWDCIQRRNIATLEAIAWGADVIVSWDNDNCPLDPDYFDDFISKFYWHNARQQYPVQLSTDTRKFHGLRVSQDSEWFDVGLLLDPPSPHRGMPITAILDPIFEHVTDAKIGVAAGICLGDPDISAVTRIAKRPIVHNVSELLRAGIVVAPGCKTVFNSQNTAFIRELAPAFFMLPGVGRYDDILASLIMQRVMRERDLHVHFGRPFVWQQRNTHNLVKDLKGEIHGMEKIEQFATFLDRLPLPDGPVIQQLRSLWNGFDKLPNSYDLVPKSTVEAALAFLEDMEGVL